MAIVLDKARIERLLRAACETLEGDWVLLGGALAAVWFSPRRTTEDVDLVGVEGRAGERLQLMRLANSLSLPVEAVNSAADFFLQRLPDWERELVLFRRGKRCRIFRVTPTAFLLLKIGRLDEKDLSDCLELIAARRRKRLTIDVPRVLRALEARPTEDQALRARRERLSAALRRRAPASLAARRKLRRSL